MQLRRTERQAHAHVATRMTPDFNHPCLVDLLHFLSERSYSFVTITPESHARVLARSQVGTSLRDAFGWNRLFSLDCLPEALVAPLADAGLIEPHGDMWRSRIRVSSLEGIPFVHSAYPTSGADDVFFGPDTYRFSSAIRRWLAANPPPARAADIGTGSGAAGILIASAAPQCSVTLADINSKALALSQINARAARVRNVTVVQSDVLSATQGNYDLIVANPPYMVDPGKRAYRDGGGPYGTSLSARILRESLGRLRPNGTCLLYTGTPVVDGTDVFLREAEQTLTADGFRWRYEELDPDVFGEELAEDVYSSADRLAAVLLTVTKSGQS